jgi:hypothetical protein
MIMMLSSMGMEGDVCTKFHNTGLAVINRYCEQCDLPESTYMIFIKPQLAKAFSDQTHT